jgi:hypothetical protein
MTSSVLTAGSENDSWQVITNRRVVIAGRKKVDSFDLDLLRRILGSTPGEPVPDLTRFQEAGVALAKPAGIIDLAGVLALAQRGQEAVVRGRL